MEKENCREELAQSEQKAKNPRKHNNSKIAK